MARRPEHVRDVTSAAGLGVVAVLYLLANLHYPLDSLATPGPGVFPLAAGLLALVLAGIQIARGIRATDPPPSPPSPGDRDVKPHEGAPGSPRRAYGMIALLVASTAAIGTLGFLPVSFVLGLGAGRLLGARGWVAPIALALGVTVATWVIFVVWLGVPLPAGIIRPRG